MRPAVQACLTALGLALGSMTLAPGGMTAARADSRNPLDGFWQDPTDPGAWIEYRDGQMIEWLDGRRMSASAVERAAGPDPTAPADPNGPFLRYLDEPTLHEQIVQLDANHLRLKRPAVGSDIVLRRLLDASDLARARQPTLRPAPARQAGGCSPLLIGFDYTASSTLADSDHADYAPFRLADGRSDTAWVEGAAGTGVGEMLALDLQGVRQQYLDDDSGELPSPEPIAALALEGLQLVNGYPKTERLYAANGRVARLDLTLDGVAVGSWSLEDHPEPQAITFDPPLLLQRSERLQLTLAAVQPGDRYSDTAIAELLPVVYGCAQILAVD